MLPLFPEIKPYKTSRFAVTPPHELHVEECGNPDGVPVLFLHGGPGAGCGHNSRRFYDPKAYRIILFDQRGAGQSEPHACTDNNTLADLISDIEALLNKLAVERCILFGGSWGATLALAFAQARPERVRGLILRGVFLCRQRDIDWFYREGASRVFPDAWQSLLRAAPDPDDIIGGFHRALQSSNDIQRMGAARAWAAWGTDCSTFRVHKHDSSTDVEERNALAMARLETHYFMHQGFLEENQLLEQADRLQGIPGIIVHGRYDMVCPLDNATALHERWPESELRIIREGGHSPFEPAMADALVHATNDMLEWLTNKSA